MPMKSAVTIFLLALMASIQTPVGQFLKLPLLVQHHIKHKKQDGTSLIAFLEDHYSRDHDDADRPEDEQLPFKNITFYSIGYAIITPIIQANVLTSPSMQTEITFPDTYTAQQFLASIFHPPRV